MGDWIERNKGHVIVLLLSLILNGGLVLMLNRPAGYQIRIVPPTATPVRTTVRVFVSGAVLAPDVYEIPIDSLVKDALLAAGGHTSEANLDQINLARQVKDQEQLFVPYRSAGPEAPTDRLLPLDLSQDRINLNTATRAELESLPGIGPGLAQRIIDYRADNGSFASVEEVMNVSGIGKKTYEQMKDRLVVN